jgi:hypothetical protein
MHYMLTDVICAEETDYKRRDWALTPK